jgi:hypothetical protein
MLQVPQEDDNRCCHVGRRCDICYFGSIIDISGNNCAATTAPDNKDEEMVGQRGTADKGLYESRKRDKQSHQ